MKWWRDALEHVAAQYPSQRQECERRIDQIVGNWGMFESTMVQPSGGKGRRWISASAMARK